MRKYEERCRQIGPEVMRLTRQSALIAKMANVRPTPEIEQTDWNFGITSEQLEGFLAALNAELAADDLSPENA